MKLETYLAFIDSFDHEINNAPIVIVRDKDKIKSATIWSTAGIICDDKYYRYVRDPVVFSKAGKKGTYLRLIPKNQKKSGDISGVVVVPKLGGNYVLIRSYRHATREWELGFPRGFLASNSTIGHASVKELVEETGYNPLSNPEIIGTVYPDSGILSAKVAVSIINVSEVRDRPQHEAEEAIDNNVSILSYEEICERIRSGSICDGLTIAAMTFLRIFSKS